MSGTLFLTGVLDLNISAQESFDSASLIDLLTVIQRNDVALLTLAPLHGLGALGSGLSGSVYQTIADVAATLAFKNATPNYQRFDDQHTQDWYSLITEITILSHVPIKKNPFITDLVGINWTYELVDGFGSTWPQIITKKAECGDLDKFLRNENLDGPTRLLLCTHVLCAVATLHSCGVAHGDIKPKNIVVDTNSNGIYQGRVLDFGGSAIVAQERLPQGTVPWAAPELSHEDGRYCHRPRLAEELIKGDLYSLGLLIPQILIPYNVLLSSNLDLLGLEDEAEGRRALEKMHLLLSHERLSEIFIDLALNSGTDPSCVSAIQNLLPGLLQRDFEKRTLSKHADELIAKYATDWSLSTRSTELLQLPPMAGSSTTSGSCLHDVFLLEKSLDIIDNFDYAFRQDIANDMIRKIQCSTCAECKKAYEAQLALYYRIGFGVRRELAESDRHRILSGLTASNLEMTMKVLESDYGRCESASEVVTKELGINTLIRVDPLEQYRFTGRLSFAEQFINEEIVAREAQFGPESVCTAKLKSTLAQIFSAKGFTVKAENTQREVLSTLTKAFGVNDGFTMEAKSTLGLLLAKHGFLALAEKILKEASDSFKVLSSHHPQYLFVQHNLAITVFMAGRHNEAAEILERVKESRVKILGEQHLLVIKAEIDLAMALLAEGHLLKANKLMDAVAKKGSDVGDAVIKVTICLSLIDLYVQQGKFDKARAMSVQANGILEEQAGQDDSLVWDAWEREAMVWRDRAEYKKEEEIILRCIDRKLKASSDVHYVNLLSSRISLAANFRLQNRLDDAIAELESVLAELGDDLNLAPVCVFHARDALAQCFWQAGRREQAESEHRQLLKLFENHFGGEHPLTLKAVASYATFFLSQSMWNSEIELLESFVDGFRKSGRVGATAVQLARYLVLAYREANKYDQSIALCQEALAWSTELVGPEHEDPRSLRMLLGGIYFYMGQAGQAESVFKELAEDSKGKKWEPFYLSNLADVKTQLGYVEEAKCLLEKSAELAQKWGGVESPDVLKVKGSLLGLQLNHDQLTPELLEQVDEVIDLKKKVFGVGHPTTIKTLTDKADALMRDGAIEPGLAVFRQLEELNVQSLLQNKLRYATYLAKWANAFFYIHEYEKSEELERSALAIRKHVLSEDSPAILLSMSNLASVLCRQRRFEEAKKYQEHVAAVRHRLLGRESRRTLDAMNDLAAIYFHLGLVEDSMAILKENVEISERIEEPLEKQKYRRDHLKDAQQRLEHRTLVGHQRH